jgi:hypothetical protein
MIAGPQRRGRDTVSDERSTKPMSAIAFTVRGAS